MNSEQIEQEVKRLERRLHNARKRALYWSGNPSFTGNRFSPSRTRADSPETEYETALCDIEALCLWLEGLDGKPRKRSDPRKAFRDRYARGMARAFAAPQGRDADRGAMLEGRFSSSASSTAIDTLQRAAGEAVARQAVFGAQSPALFQPVRPSERPTYYLDATWYLDVR